MSLRIGNGYDMHRLVPGRPLILGGIELNHPEGLGLDGHSDADVLTHAIMDAILGALSLGDIGKYFPPDDPKWKNADSLILLEKVMELIENKGWMIWPIIPFNYQTVNYDLESPAPSPPSADNWLGTDDQARDVLARLIYGFRISIIFGLTRVLLIKLMLMARQILILKHHILNLSQRRRNTIL